MGRADLAERIDTVEHRMDSMEQRLDASFNALSTQILQSSRETNDAILASRAEVATEFSTMRGRFESLETAMVGSWAHFENSIAASQDDNRRYMKVLYEDLRSQIKLLNEGHPSSS
ncbi:MAG: hypothetical protein NTV05_07570 [Acidobacteria bacterium]|nr:hypothetical protein [Acidobacteriota bacterium]